MSSVWANVVAWGLALTFVSGMGAGLAWGDEGPDPTAKKTVYLANPYGFSAQQREGPLPALVATFAAGMSTVDSQMLSAGSLFVRDLVSLVVTCVDQRSNYLIGRWATMSLLVLLYLWSLTLQSQPVLGLIVFGMSLTVIFIPCVFGMFYWRQATSMGASWSMSLGLLVFLVKQFRLFGLDVYLPVMGPITWALIAATVTFVVVSLLTSSEGIAAKRREYDELLGAVAKKDRLSGTMDSG